MKSDWKEYLESALDLRRGLFVESESEGTDSFRIFNGFREGIPGLVIEQYGRVLVFQLYEPDWSGTEAQLIQMALWLFEKRSASSAYKKVFIQDRSKQAAGEDHYSPTPFVGESCEESISCGEKGISFWIQPYSGFSTGLFLDQRNNRAFLAGRSAGKKVLNLFSYTCAFSLACAKAGASTTSVDLSAKYLEWGKRNFDLNQIRLEEHRFIARDVFEFLKQAQKKNITYDLVIADPPSFSRTKKGGVFSIKKDLEKLLRLLHPLVAEGGELFFSCNFSEWDSKLLQKKAEKVLEEEGKWKWLDSPSSPIDFKNTLHPLSQIMVKRLQS